jgi:nucleoid DNA-binding protein
MTKIDLSKELYERNYKWLFRIEAPDMVKLLIDTLKGILLKEKPLRYQVLGHSLCGRKEREKAEIFKTGEEISIAPRKVVTLR